MNFSTENSFSFQFDKINIPTTWANIIKLESGFLGLFGFALRSRLFELGFALVYIRVINVEWRKKNVRLHQYVDGCCAGVSCINHT
jgi:hypothetical protein